jgi:serine protease Do
VVARFRHFSSRVAVCLAIGVLGVVGSRSAAAQLPADAIPEPGSLEQLRSLEARSRQTASSVMRCVVAIRLRSGQGSGVIVSADGYVATAGHLIDKPGEDVTFVMADGTSHQGRTLGADRAIDSGLMKLDRPGPWPFVAPGTSRDVRPGTWCVAIGHPFGFQEDRPPVVRVGRVLANQTHVMRTDCAIVAGDSGGPLFDLDGHLLGIHSRIGTSVTMNYHVPIDRYRADWELLAAGRLMNEDLPLHDSPSVKALLRPVAEPARQCVVRVRSAGRDAALGTVVGPQGWILTKASELGDQVSCVLADGRELVARLVGVDPQLDLALLKVGAERLPVVTWSDEEPGVGQWVASLGAQPDPITVGVQSVPVRRIPPPVGVLGVYLADERGGGKILQVMPGSAAEKAGLLPDDLIVRVSGRPIADREQAIANVKRFRPGDAVRLTFLRSGKTRDVDVTLQSLDTPGTQKRERQNTMSGSLSRRRDDFPQVLQHDSVLAPSQCGGPLVDLNGRVIGLNIARAGRTETYALPAKLLLSRMGELMSGHLAPPAKETSAASRPAQPGDPKPASSDTQLPMAKKATGG